MTSLMVDLSMTGSSFVRRSFASALGVSALGLAALTASTALAGDPDFRSIKPAGLQRGTATDVEITGNSLGDVEELMIFGLDGVKVEGLKAEDKKVTAKMTVPAETTPGFYGIRLRGRTGLSQLETFSVGTLPQSEEKEPNSDFTAPQPITLNTTIEGRVEREDVDYFVVEAKKGQRLVAEVEGLRLGREVFDPYIAILDEKRFELARCDDVALLLQDPFVAITVPEDGKYIIQLRETSYGGNGNYVYRLHVGTFPRPAAVLPNGVKPGQTVDLTWYGDPAGEWTQTVTIPETAVEKVAVLPSRDGQTAPSPLMLRVSALPGAVEKEPNDARDQATPGEVPGSFAGRLQTTGDTDFFKFAGKKGQAFEFKIIGRDTLRSPIDATLALFAPKGNRLQFNDDSGGLDSTFRATLPEDGDYTIQIGDHLGSGGVEYAYRVEIAPVEPKLTITLPEQRQYVSTNLVVPKANRAVLMVGVTRQDFGGDVTLSFEGLPSGVNVVGAPIVVPAAVTTYPVLFEATKDANVTGAPVVIKGKATVGEKTVEGSLVQHTMLVRGQNNRDMWGFDQLALAAAVAEPLPFTVEMDVPKVPIPRNGNLDLTVKVKRNEGFDGDIRLRLPFDPPGVSSSRSVSIKKGEESAKIPITANNGAAVGKWPLVVYASAADEAAGRDRCATQIDTFEVVDKFFDLTFDKAAIVQGEQTRYTIKIAKRAEYNEPVKMELLGLPNGLTTEPVTVDPKAEEATFTVKAAADAKPGVYKSLVCRAIIERNGEPITHTLGNGEIRVDAPPPPPKDAPKVAAKPAEAKPAAPAEKKLTRLEQLRLEREAALKAAGN